MGFAVLAERNLQAVYAVFQSIFDRVQGINIRKSKLDYGFHKSTCP